MALSLSIVIPSHKRVDLLRNCLETVVRYAPAQTEILVVDDGSAREEVSAMACKFPVIRTIRLANRQGFCVAANCGLRAARGTVVELLNDDTEVTKGWAEAALECFADPQVAAVAPLVLFRPGGLTADVPRVDSAGDRYYVGGIAAKRGHGESLAPHHLQPRFVFGASASSAFYRREAVLQVGCFPEEFGAYLEDVDLAFRLHHAGFRIAFEPGSLVYHHTSSSYGRRSRRLLEMQSTNEERVFWRNLPVAILLGSLPKHLAVVAGKAWRRCQDGDLSPFVFGRLRVLGEIAKMLRHRRQLNYLLAGTSSSHAWQLDKTYWKKIGLWA